MARATGLLFLVATAAVGCAHAVSSAPARGVHATREEVIQGPYVPAGTRFTVRMNEAIDSESSRPGQRFTAQVEAPLRTADGALVVPSGATVRGLVASTGSADAPRVRLSFESVETVVGAVPLQAAIRHADHVAYRGAPRLRATPAPAYAYPGGYGIYPYSTGVPVYDTDLWGPPIGGGPDSAPYGTFHPREVHVARGARIELELTRPLLAPGTSVVR